MVGTANGRLGRRAVLPVQEVFSIDSAPVTILSPRMGVKTAHHWELIKRKRFVIHTFAQVGL